MSTCKYTRATSIDTAIESLVEAKGEAHVIAGGIALGILMNEKLVQPSWLIDISGVEAFRGIELLEDGTLRIGAMETHHAIQRSEIVSESIPMLTEMAAEIACGRIKNRGTIGGNICLADPQGDPPIAALALGATLRAVGNNGTRDIPVADFFTDLYTTALSEDELLQDIRFPPLPANCGAAYGKFAARNAMDYTSTVSIAVRVVVDPDEGTITEVGLGSGGVGFIPVCPKLTEALFIGRRPDPETFAAARQALFEELEPIEDHLYSADYKRHVVSVILRRTMERAYARALPQTGASSP